jgi:hypothetical protein
MTNLGTPKSILSIQDPAYNGITCQKLLNEDKNSDVFRLAKQFQDTKYKVQIKPDNVFGEYAKDCKVFIYINIYTVIRVQSNYYHLSPPPNEKHTNARHIKSLIHYRSILNRATDFPLVRDW